MPNAQHIFRHVYLENLIKAACKVKRVNRREMERNEKGRITRTPNLIYVRMLVCWIASEAHIPNTHIAKVLHYSAKDKRPDPSGVRNLILAPMRWPTEKLHAFIGDVNAVKKEMMLTSPSHQISRLGKGPSL